MLLGREGKKETTSIQPWAHLPHTHRNLSSTRTRPHFVLPKLKLPIDMNSWPAESINASHNRNNPSFDASFPKENYSVWERNFSLVSMYINTWRSFLKHYANTESPFPDKEVEDSYKFLIPCHIFTTLLHIIIYNRTQMSAGTSKWGCSTYFTVWRPIAGHAAPRTFNIPEDKSLHTLPMMKIPAKANWAFIAAIPKLQEG